MNPILEFAQSHPILVVLWLTALVMLLASFGRAAAKSIAPQQLTDLVNREDAVVLDIRPQADFAKGHIVGAVSAPMAKLDSQLKDLERYKTRPVIVVCQSGMTATNAAKLLKKHGFEQLFLLNQGMQGWLADNLPVTKK